MTDTAPDTRPLSVRMAAINAAADAWTAQQAQSASASRAAARMIATPADIPVLIRIIPCERCGVQVEREINPFSIPRYCSDDCLYAAHPELIPSNREVTPTLTPEQRRQAAWDLMCPARYQSYEWAKLKPAAQKAAARIKDLNLESKPAGLVLHGASESGKSFLAYRVAYRLHMAGHSVTLMDVPSLWEIIAYDPDNRDDAEARAKTSQILMLDDLGMESASTGWIAAIYRIIDRREREGLPTILTTNRDAAYFGTAYGSPLANRLERLGEWINVESSETQ